MAVRAQLWQHKNVYTKHSLLQWIFCISGIKVMLSASSISTPFISHMYWWLAAYDIFLVTMGQKYLFLVKLFIKQSRAAMPSVHTGKEIAYLHSFLLLYVNLLVHNYLFVNTTTERLVLYYCKRKIHYNFCILGMRIHYLRSSFQEQLP